MTDEKMSLLQMVRQKHGKFMVHADPAFASRIDAFLPDPDVLFSHGEPIVSPWKSAATDKVKIRVDGCSYFFKRYNDLGLAYGLKNFFRPSRALRSWKNGLRFQENGIPTVSPLLCIEERSAGLLKRSYVLFSHLPNAVSLLDGWESFDTSMRKSALKRLANIFGQMHAKGIYHGDLNWRNVLVESLNDRTYFYLVDLDGCRFKKEFEAKEAEKDLSHFYRDIKRAGIDEDTTDLFREEWFNIVNSLS